MARVDAEAVLDDLTAWIAEAKTGYGRTELLEQIARLRKRHRVGEDLLERAIRLFGGPRELLRHLTRLIEETPETPPADADAVERGDDKVHATGHTKTRGGHDGSRNGAHAGA